MGRTSIKAINQPDDLTCGPTSLKTALEIIGIRKSLKSLIPLCKTNSNGVSVPNLIRAANKCGVYVMSVKGADLRHVKSALKTSRHVNRATIVDYLYQGEEPVEDTGHYATVSSFSKPKNRLVLFDSSIGRKKSYSWPKFLENWYDYEFCRVKNKKSSRHFKLYRRWYNRLLLILATDPKHFPKFKIKTAKFFLPKYASAVS